MSKYLAVAALQSLDRDVLKTLIQAVKDTDENPALVQSHYRISGSLEGYMETVKAAYDGWRRSLDYDNDLRYSYILGVFPDYIVAYGYDDDDESLYAKVAYSIGSDGVTFGDVTAVDVNLVVSTLGIGSVQSAEVLETETASDAAQTQTAEMETPTEVTPAETTETPAIEAAVPVVDAEIAPVEAPVETNTQAAEAATEIAPVVDAEALTGETLADTQTSALAFDSDKFLAQSAFGDKTKVLQGTGYDFENKLVCKVTQSTEVEVNGKKHLKIQGIATRGNIVNANGFVYPTSVWQANLDYMNAEAASGKFVGKLEPPDTELGLQDVAILFHSFHLQGDDLHFEGIVVPTKPYGENLQIMIEAGVQIDLSSRGFGSVVTQSWEGVNRPIIQNDFICTAFDAVWHGASFGSGITSAEYQSKNTPTKSDDLVETQEQTTTVENTISTETIPVVAAPVVEVPVVQSVSPAQEEARRLRATAELSSYRADLVAQSALSNVGKAALQNAIAKCDTIDAVFQAKEAIMPVLAQSFPVEVAQADAPLADGASTYAPRFFVKQSAAELAPKNVGEMFDRLVADLPDTYPGLQSTGNVPNHFKSPREACKMLMTNIAREVQGAFNGRAAARALLAMEQGRPETAEDILTQSFSSDSSVANGNVEGDGAPLSAPLIFPLVRRVFPMYILNRIAAIQPMDRPTGKIFYIDHLRTADPSTGNEKRIDLNTSANPFNPTYADNNVEGSKAKLLRMRLNSVLVQAQTKKLGAQWSIEEMQDLRAYHGLDASVELMSAVAKEMAQEINLEVLNDMAAQATGGARTFGTGLPTTGFPEQEKWDAYIWVYLNALSNDIYGKRNAPATHLVVGMDAALALSKSMRGVFTTGNTPDGSGNMESYPGTTFYGSINTPTGEKFEVFKTNYWATGTPNANKIMAIRKGSDWSDTPYIYAPYTDYMTPQFTDPEDFSQKQGVMNRSARKVVVSDNIALLTVNNSVGVPL